MHSLDKYTPSAFDILITDISAGEPNPDQILRKKPVSRISE